MARMMIACLLCAISLAGGDDPKLKLTPEAQRLLDLTNEARQKEDLPPFKVNAALVEMARKHTQAMAKAMKLDHTIDGVGPDQRFKNAGKFLAWAENIQCSKRKGVDAADFAMKQWLESAPHRKNLLNKDFTDVGIGAVRNGAGEIYFTQALAATR